MKIVQKYFVCHETWLGMMYLMVRPAVVLHCAISFRDEIVHMVVDLSYKYMYMD